MRGQVAIVKKSEGRNPEAERRPKSENRTIAKDDIFGISTFGFLSTFGFRRQVIFVTLQLTTKDFLDHFAVDICQSAIDSVVTESQLLVINAKLMQNRRV